MMYKSTLFLHMETLKIQIRGYTIYIEHMSPTALFHQKTSPLKKQKHLLKLLITLPNFVQCTNYL